MSEIKIDLSGFRPFTRQQMEEFTARINPLPWQRSWHYANRRQAPSKRTFTPTSRRGGKRR